MIVHKRLKKIHIINSFKNTCYIHVIIINKERTNMHSKLKIASCVDIDYFLDQT